MENLPNELKASDLQQVCHWMEWEDQPSSADNLKDWLRNRIAWMLDHQPERLMQAFYRLDVSETKVKAVFSSQASDLWADGLAELVLDREKQRVYWKSKYKGS